MSTIGRWTHEIICWSLLEKRYDIWNPQLHEMSNNILRRKQLHGRTEEVRDNSVALVDLEQKDWWQ